MKSIKENHRFMNLFLIFLLLIIFSPFLLAVENSEKNVYYFWGVGCPHCENVKNSGVIEQAKKLDKVNVYEFEVYYNETNRELYNRFADQFKIGKYDRGIPFLVIECSKGYSYFIGDKPIINNLIDSLNNCNPMVEISESTPSNKPFSNELTIGAIILAALVDSINPCAFGVLIFLLATMLSISSPKRALKYGLIYSFVVFFVYFSAGLGLLKIISNFSSLIEYFIVISGFLVLIGGLIEVKDFFWYGKGYSLSIPKKFKPFIERTTQKGTIFAVILLGFVVALIELPCTGGIYLAILSLMHINKTSGIPYLVLYNLIFVLPLVIIVLSIYNGSKIETISKWVENNKKFMRLAAGIVMIILAIYLLNSVYNWI